MQPPPLPYQPPPRSSVDKGEWSRGGAEGQEASLPLLTLARVHPLHTPRDSRHKCLSAPHLCTLPPLLPSVMNTAGGKRGDGLGGVWGCSGHIPCSIPMNFLISFAYMLCPKFTPLTYPPASVVMPPLPSHLFSLFFFG